MIERTLPFALVLLLSVLLYFGYGRIQELTTERDDLAAQLEVSKLRTQRLQRSVLAATAKAATAERSLKEAMNVDPEDRDAPVPVPVRDSLCSTLRCK